MQIKIFVTGGTIDKTRLGPPSVGYEQQKSSILEMLGQSFCTLPVSVENLMNKSSRNISDDDRKLIVRKCTATPEHRILVTHGTITMSETAKYLCRRIKGKTIVLTGAFVPFKVKNSDALFNLGAALMAVQTLPPGVYVCMHGEVYQYNYRYYKH